MSEEKTHEEKIDYIYNHIKTERKFIYGRRIFKFILYSLFIAYLYYFYTYGFEKLMNSVIESVKPSINTESVLEGLEGGSSDIIQKAKELIQQKVNSNDQLDTMQQLEQF